MASSKQTVKKFLNKILKNQVDKDDTRITINNISTNGANFLSHVFSIEISKPDLQLFAKVITLGEKGRGDMPLPFIENELLFYKSISSIFKQLENKHEVPIQCRLNSVKLYDCQTTYLEEVFIFEDAMAKGYQSFDRFTTVDWKYSTSAIEELAKLHALSIAYSEENPKDFKKLAETINANNAYARTLNPIFAQSFVMALEAANDEYKAKLRQHFAKTNKWHDVETYFKVLRRPALVHSDYRPSNLLHKLKSDGTYQICMVDFQTLQVTSPVIDLIYFIFTSTDEEFRSLYFKKICDHYYIKLGLALKQLHVNIEEVYTREDFEYELKEMLPFGLIVAIIALPIVTVDVDEAPKNDADLVMSSFSIKSGSLYAQRWNGILSDYVKWGVL